MSEASMSRVTITLGRTGQVVKRAGSASDVALSDSMFVTGKKRSIRDRLGSNADSSLMHGGLYNESGKRQRGDTGMSSLNANGIDDVRIDKGDLRYKLMQKKASQRAENNNDQKLGDLREKLSKAIRVPLPTVESHQHVPEPKKAGFTGQIPSTRSADDMHRVESCRSSYSPWTLDHLRRRSPERTLGTYMGLSPSRSVKDLQRKPVSRTLKDFRSVPDMSADVIDTSRAMSSVAYALHSTLPPRSTLPPGSSKPVPPLHMNQLPLSSGILSRSLYPVGDAAETVDGLLHSLGLGKYAIIFKVEEVDMAALKQMGENDLKELGVPMGPRKKILLALLPRSKR